MTARTATGPTAGLAEFAATLSLWDVPEEVVTRAQHLILDGLGCGLFAAKLDWSERAVDALTPLAGHGEAQIWGWGRATDPVTAATLNGTFVQGFELDDYHEFGPLHSESCVLPALLAADSLDAGATGEDLLLATIVGFETGPRIGIALGGLDLIARGWHCGPINGTISSAVATARLLGLDRRGTEHAIGIAATQAAGLMSAQYESMVKRMHSGFAARNGLIGATLARNGFTGIDRVLEREYGGLASCYGQGGETDVTRVTAGLGTDWETMRIAVKPYSCMGGLHTAVDAMRSICTEEGVAAEDIAGIRIGLAEAMYHHGGWKIQPPATSIGAQMSIAYVVAVTALDGTAFVDQFAPERLQAPEVWALVDRVETYHDPQLDALGEHGRWSCRMDVETLDGVHHRRDVRHQRGSFRRPVSNEEIVVKFDALASRVIEAAERARIFEAVMDLPQAPDVGALRQALAVAARAPFATAPPAVVGDHEVVDGS